MHKINIHNYEAYLLDFSEGNLTGEFQVELELFLIQHPELEINLDELILATLEEDSLAFSNKHSLKRSESDLVSETQFIAYVENQLSGREKLELEKSCATNPSLLKELKLYTHTIAAIDTSIVFENKAILKRKPKVIWFNFSATQYAAAACLMFLIGLFMLWPRTNNSSETLTLADKTDGIATPSLVPNNSRAAKTSTQTGALGARKKPNIVFPEQQPIVKKEQALFATNNVSQKHNTPFTKDSLHQTTNNEPVVELPKNETLIAANKVPVSKPNTLVEVITENDDEPVVTNSPTKKKGIWAKASRAFKNLNNIGVKTVNGDEEKNTDNTAYAITLGGVSITHKAGL